MIQPAFVNEEAQQRTKLVDLSVMKKGLNYHGYDEKKLKREHETINVEREKQARQEQLLSKQQQLVGTDQDKKKDGQASKSKDV